MFVKIKVCIMDRWNGCFLLRGIFIIYDEIKFCFEMFLKIFYMINKKIFGILIFDLKFSLL